MTGGLTGSEQSTLLDVIKTNRRGFSIFLTAQSQSTLSESLFPVSTERIIFDTVLVSKLSWTNLWIYSDLGISPCETGYLVYWPIGGEKNVFYLSRGKPIFFRFLSALIWENIQNVLHKSTLLWESPKSFPSILSTF